MCMYLSEGKYCNFDKITAVSYLVLLAVTGFFFFFFLLFLSCQLETLHRYIIALLKYAPVFEQKKNVPDRKNKKIKLFSKFYEVWME